MAEHPGPAAPTEPRGSSEPVALVHGERAIPAAARVLRSQLLPAAVIPVGTLTTTAALAAAGVLTRGSGKGGLLVLPFFFTGMLLHLWTRPRRPCIALYQDRTNAAVIRHEALRRRAVPREQDRAKSAGVRSCEDLEGACLLGGALVAVVALMVLWGAGTLWPALVIVSGTCVGYGVRAVRAWHYLGLLHGR